MPRSNAVPSLRRHKPSNRAVVTIDGQDFYCGPWNPQRRRPNTTGSSGSGLLMDAACVDQASPAPI